MKNLILYQGKYGATRQYAKWLSEDLQLPAFPAEAYDANGLEPGGLLVMGSSVYIGKLQITKWVNKYLNQLYGRQLVLFVVSGTPVNETEKLKNYISSLPDQIADRCHIFYLPGRLIYDKLSWRDRLMLSIGAMFAGSREEKERMLKGYDNVKREHLAEISTEIKRILLQEEAPANRHPVPSS